MTREEAIKAIKTWDFLDNEEKEVLETLIPELQESDDERIRKWLISGMNALKDQKNETFATIPIDDCITWLEKQGKQKPIYFNADNWQVSKVDGKIHNIYHSGVEPKFHKFHESDWVVCEITGSLYQIRNCIESLSNHKYGYILTNGDYIGSDEVNHYHLWTIADAKPGDVLAFNNDTIVIFKDLYNSSTFHSYCHIEDGIFDISKDELPDWWEGKGFQPATKEQRDLLFAAMKNAGYEWDKKKKDLKKIYVIDDGKAEGEQKLANSTKTCNDEDTLLSLLQQMPSCITVDGIDYHFVLKKTIAYMIFYEGEGEGSGKVIFWMAGEPVDICKEMLKRLEKEGLI